MAGLASLVEIGFPTHNRWEDVRNTLTRLAEFGLGGLRVLIVDDGSDEPCPFDVTAICPRAELRRHAESRGMIVRRNEIARAMRAKYYFGLDDDSYPVSGSLEEAVEFAEGRPDLLSLSFPIYNPRLDRHEVASRGSEPYPARAFIGCGHLMHRERFLDLGGFCEELGYFLEEWELAGRGFVRGLRCYHFPGLQIHHLASTRWRDWHRMDYYGARNDVWWNDWYLPPSRKPIKHARNLVSRLLQTARTRRTASLRGYWAGQRSIPLHRHRRQPMSVDQFREWRCLPFT
jgi:GT2 family glycosyltransferase